MCINYCFQNHQRLLYHKNYLQYQQYLYLLYLPHYPHYPLYPHCLMCPTLKCPQYPTQTYPQYPRDPTLTYLLRYPPPYVPATAQIQIWAGHLPRWGQRHFGNSASDTAAGTGRMKPTGRLSIGLVTDTVRGVGVECSAPTSTLAKGREYALPATHAFVEASRSLTDLMWG